MIVLDFCQAFYQDSTRKLGRDLRKILGGLRHPPGPPLFNVEASTFPLGAAEHRAKPQHFGTTLSTLKKGGASELARDPQRLTETHRDIDNY